MLNNPSMNITNNNTSNSEYNNKLALECSYLINEIKRKNSKLFLPLYINNKKIYLHNKLLFDKVNNLYSKSKNSKKKFISRNVIKNNNLTKNKSEGNLPLKKYPNSKDNLRNNISLASLYNLPTLKPKNKLILNKSLIMHKNKFNILEKKEEPKVTSTPKKKNKFLGLENYMRDKFYSDTEKKLENKIKTIYFRKDAKIKDKIIFIKKFGIFWKEFILYCTPIINLKKYQIDYQHKKQNNFKSVNEKIYKGRNSNISDNIIDTSSYQRNNKSASKSYCLPIVISSKTSKTKINLRNNSQIDKPNRRSIGV